MNYDEIIAEIRKKLGDSREENEKILKAEAERFVNEKNAAGVDAVSQLVYENMPEERRAEVDRITHVDGVRLDEMYKKIVDHINKGEYVEAKPLAERLYKKITVEFREGETAKFVSLRNPFEDNLYQILFKPDKKLNRAPYDFATFITSYAYIMLETGSPLDAIPILKKAEEFNPVDVGPKFELCEVYKLLKNKKRLLETTREILKVASSPVAIARAYANVGYILTDFQEYEDAACFYIGSAMFAPNPAIPREMQHLADLKGSPIYRPNREKIIETMNKYEIEFGPNQKVIEIAAQMSLDYQKKNEIPNAVRTLKILYNLTLDEQVKKTILAYEPEARMIVPADNEEKPNIQQTVNNVPENDEN